MAPEDVDRVWKEFLAAVRRAHDEGEDRRLRDALRRAAETGEAPEIPPPPAGIEEILAHLHRVNFALWHVEDEARRRDAGDRYTATTKRWIDPHNQARHDAIEALDEALARAAPPAPGAPLNTETPGSALDRLSVLALKVHHTEEEEGRPDAPPAHRARMADRLARLRAQGEDLRGALRGLLADVAAGRRGFRLYRQFKMYNDPETNPAVRASRR